jgi:hypothetical protein
MLQEFYLDIVFCLQWFSSFFLHVFQKYFSSVLSVFFYTLQWLHLDVLKVDRASAVDLYLVGVDYIFGSFSRHHAAAVVSSGLR